MSKFINKKNHFVGLLGLALSLVGSEPLSAEPPQKDQPEATSSRDRFDRRDENNGRDREDRWRGGRGRQTETLVKSTRPIESGRDGMSVDVLKVLKLEKSQSEVRSLFVVARAIGRSSARLEVKVNGEVDSWTRLDRSLSSFQAFIDREVGDDLRSLEITLEGEAQIEFIGAGVVGFDSDEGKTQVITEKIKGLYENGTFDSNRAAALKSYNDACAKWKARRENEFGSKILSLSCGTLSSIGGYSGFQFESMARVEFRTSFPLRELSQAVLGIYENGTFDSNRATALADYNKRCDQFYADLSKDSEYVSYASCGTLESVGGYSGFQFSSSARIFLNADIETRVLNEKIRGIFESGTFDSDRSAALSDYETRCATWKDEMRRYNRDRIIFLSCGKITNTGGYSGFRFESDGIAILADD